MHMSNIRLHGGRLGGIARCALLELVRLLGLGGEKSGKERGEERGRGGGREVNSSTQHMNTGGGGVVMLQRRDVMACCGGGERSKSVWRVRGPTQRSKRPHRGLQWLPPPPQAKRTLQHSAVRG